MKEKFIYLKKINIIKLFVLSYIFIMSLFMFNVKVEARSANIISSTYKGNSNSKNPDAVVNVNNINYIQGTGLSNKDGIKFVITSAYEQLGEFTAMAIWEQGFTSSSGEFADYDRWYIESIACPINSYDTCQSQLDSSVNKDLIVTDEAGKFITYIDQEKLYYIIRSSNNNMKPVDGVETIADFSKFFTDREITYTYRIRNLLSANKQAESFGFKEVHVNFWKAVDDDGGSFDENDKVNSIVIEYGLAKPVSDVNSYSNYNHSDASNSNAIVCSDHKDEICIDYVDSNGVPSESTTAAKEVNIYMPNVVAYNHLFNTMDEIKDTYLSGGQLAQAVIDNNTTYALNYFCEAQSITPANITYGPDKKHIANCDGAQLRKYLYVNSQIKTQTMKDVIEFKNNQEYFIATTYNTNLIVDSRGNYVVIIRDIFNNTNETAVINVEDIINQALLAYFNKSNAKEDVASSNGWKANEYLTKDDVLLDVTMSATTVIKNGLPIVAAQTTLLDSSYVKEIRYWRVQGNEYQSDICQDGVGDGCGVKPDDGQTTLLYHSSGTGSQAQTNEDDFVKFEKNTITMKIHSNGRYRFYIETFAGNNTDNDGNGNTVKGESKNPRVEVYKIDKSFPEIKFGTNLDNKCSDASTCNHSENTYDYYQGSGSSKGSIINKLVTDKNAKIEIDYAKNLIYYVSANGEKSILASASDKDVFFTYLLALFNTETYLGEYIVKHDNSKILYSHSDMSKDNVNYTLDFKDYNSLDEESYRIYVIKNDIKYTAFSLSSNKEVNIDIPKDILLQQDNIKIEYLDGKDGSSKLCDKLGAFAIDLNNDKKIDQNDCVNYYLDHGIDFDIRITIYDVIEELVKGETGLSTKYVLGNSTTRTISVKVNDNTAPGFNKIVNRYNIGTECRVEIGNLIGKNTSDQDLDMIYKCYGITSEGPSYNFEDNVFKDLYTQDQTVNTREHVSMYILSRETNKWVNLDDGYIPNRSGNYPLLTIIRDDADTSTRFDLSGEIYHDILVGEDSAIEVQGNAIALLGSYFVDKKIVLVTPKANIKTYGESDPIFEYCVSINKNTLGIKDYLLKPFADMSVFSQIGCATYDDLLKDVTLSENVKKDLFKGNFKVADFTGKLTRQESSEYNDLQFNQKGSYWNDYVGLYKIVLGSLNITDVTKDDDYDIGEDYIIKINPDARSVSGQLVDHNNFKCNTVNTQIINGEEVTDCYKANEDDDFWVESSVKFTIKQAILKVSANGSSKVYGDIDPNSANYNKDLSGVSLLENKAYLNGYTIASSDLQYNDDYKVVLGALRRQTGEDVGIYSICNYRGKDYLDNVLESNKAGKPENNMLIIGKNVNYTDCSTFDEFANTNVRVEEHTNGILNISGDYINSRALYIRTNKLNGLYKTLNVTSDDRNNNFANYVIEYSANTFSITPSKLYVQPTPGQRREYNYSGVDEVNPWEIIVYGKKEFALGEDKFNGYTDNSPVYTTRTDNDPQSVDTDRTKLDEENYNNATETRESWKLFEDNKVYEGFKTNESYQLFNGRISLLGKTPEDGVYKNMSAGWYPYNVLSDSTLELITNGRKQCLYSNYLTTTGTDATFNQDCRNYDLNLDLNYRDLNGNKDGDVVDGQEVEIIYKSKLGYCKNTILGPTSDSDVVCDDANSTKILFEVYRREIILEFNSLLEEVPSNQEAIIYGNRYDYYKTNLFEISENSANKNFLENHLFYCYASYEDGKVGISGDCTNNKWYGLTQGDSWVNVGLEFHMHKIVSESFSDYYSSESGKAIPAGRYYIYSTISSEAKKNYKYNYLGGTLTIKTNTVGVTLNTYTKEYGNVYYDNKLCLIKDGSLLSGEKTLISDCKNVSNTKDNTYGFIINGLDSKDTISDNFVGRPIRDSNLNKQMLDLNGLQENVGIYNIKVGTIHSKNNNTFKACSHKFVPDDTDCVITTNAVINNYAISNDKIDDLTYYLYKNGGSDYSSNAIATIVNPMEMTLKESTLTINPATIKITLTKGQTKMYGCSYNSSNSTSLYSYNYGDGYGCIQTTGSNYDLGYGYTVSGDKDYYIYNNGYYQENYNFDTTYSTNAINQISKNKVIDALLIPSPQRKGYRSSALNGGVLYRVNFDLLGSGIDYANLVQAADNAQALTHYQGQSAGKYAITLGNLNSTLTSDYSETYKEVNNKVCGVDNLPGKGEEVCRNYIIDYYGNTSVKKTHTYSTTDEADTTFTITPRVAFIYAKYNSKVYGNADPNITLSCTLDLINKGICNKEGDSINVGLTQYYTKYNSLAKAPYVSSIDKNDGSISFELTNKNDTQIDVVTGAISRVGMDNAAKNVDDIVGTYNYLYDNVVTTGYGSGNYNLNFYYRTLSNGNVVIKDGVVDEFTNPFILDENNFDQYMAVNEHGNVDEMVDGVEKKVYFEINLRKISVELISFAKTYGIEDNSKYYDLGICATGDQELIYDEKGNPKCQYIEDKNSTEHGLSPSHKEQYLHNGILLQEEFKNDFNVRFVRSLGENVKCPNKNVTDTITGFFTDRTKTFTYDLGCQDGFYQALGIIDQSNKQALGYNYEITYVTGTMEIVKRTIEVIPDTDQGFQYGSYTYPSLIPAITFTNELKNANYNNATKKVVTYDKKMDSTKVVIVNRDGTKQETNIETNTLGLVSDNMTTRICLTNIDKENKFCINDRQDTYDVDNKEVSTSKYEYNQDGLDKEFTTYVFADEYANELSSRSALDRKFADSDNQRYNRNVGIYTITLGDLTDHSGNYTIKFKEGVSYTITPSNILITPNNSQSKIYGESDKELTFTVTTTYKVNSTQYVTYDDSILTIIDKDNTSIKINRDLPAPILVTKGSTITLNGFAYYENADNANYNYGKVKNSNKSTLAGGVVQSEVNGKSYDKYCYDNYSNNSTLNIGVIEGCSNQDVTFTSTELVLVGYLYVENYTQRYGQYNIVNGIVVSDNEFNNKNYELTFTDQVKFKINKLDINLIINPITKIYGQATDSYKCESLAGCNVDTSILTAQDNENMLEFNFDISYIDSKEVIKEGTYLESNEVLMVNAINNKYYTQSESREDKNNFLGVNVVRKNNNDTLCSVDGDKYGCEDAGEYNLAIRKFDVILDENKDGSNRYDDNYNLMVDNVVVNITKSENEYVAINYTSHAVEELESINIVSDYTETLTINKKAIDIFVNTNLNISETNYYEIEQNIEVPALPTIDNSYNLDGYKYNPNATYHGVGENASSSSKNPDLDSTYTKIVWGNHPNQVRTKDALVGEVSYCNEPVDGNKYLDRYPTDKDNCTGSGQLVYKEDKVLVNTSIKNKFIVITRDTSSNRGLKILPTASTSNVANNDYENKNYTATFYPGAVHVVSDEKDPVLTIGNKDYYIEANAKYEDGKIVGSYSSLGTILEYLSTISKNNYILAKVNKDGNLAIVTEDKEIVVTSASLWSEFGSSSSSYPGIVSGIEQAGVYPFISEYAHSKKPIETSKEGTYLNETNITLLEELITTFVKWFDVNSYDSGQYLNGQYLPRKFDKYYYLAINKFGYDIGNDVDNEFSINKVGTYNISFYVMDNSGRISKDGNIARLHIIDTTKPELGTINLFNTRVKCDENCDNVSSWYINENKVRLSSFNRYKKVTDGEYVLDSAGDYIYFSEVGNDANPYKLISSLTLTTEGYIKYVDTSKAKYLAEGVRHYTWDSNPKGIYLVITGGRDNSFTINDDSNMSQWRHYYSLDGGNYWVDYSTKKGMEGYNVLLSDGVREINIMTIDNGVSIKSNNSFTYQISYSACYNNCPNIDVINKANIKGNIVEFTDSKIKNSYFMYDSNTKCTINKLGTLISCDEQGNKTEVKLEGNRFTFKGINYILLGNNVLVAGNKEYKAKIMPTSVTLAGVDYRYSSSAGSIYKDHYARFGSSNDEYKELIIDSITYQLYGDELRRQGSTVAMVENGKFTLNGLTYVYIVDASKEDYFYAVEEYKVYQDSYIIDGQSYSISNVGEVSIGGNVIKITKHENFTDTYSKYERFLKGVNMTYSDSITSGNNALKASDAVINFTINITSNLTWNRADKDVTGHSNKQVSDYLDLGENTLYYQDRQSAYLDTTSPNIGIVMTEDGQVVRYGDGDKLFTYEFGYFNTTKVDAKGQYHLRNKTFTIDKENSQVVDQNAKTYKINQLQSEDATMQFSYEIDYVTYYLDANMENVKWLPAYIEKYVGGKDTSKGGSINPVEIPLYDIRSSAMIGGISTDTIGPYRLMNENSTDTTLSSGIGSDKFKTKGTNNLYDFIYLGQYQTGIYYEDIDYIVSYNYDGQYYEDNLNDEFKACYDNYTDPDTGKHMITQDCAQNIIKEVIRPRGDIKKDITYDILYVVRDKAGNPSPVVAKGVIYATIFPSTNVIISNIPETLNNSKIETMDLGNNTYSLKANQGVSLELLNQAFSINYSTGAMYHNYNNDAYMSIYRDDELIAENVQGVNFTDYIDSTQIADYTIVYNMDSKYTPTFGEPIDLSGEEVTLYLSIASPKVDVDNNMTIDDITNNNSFIIALTMILTITIGFAVLFVSLLLKKKRK